MPDISTDYLTEEAAIGPITRDPGLADPIGPPLRGRAQPSDDRGDYAFEIQFAGLDILRDRAEINYPREALRKSREGVVSLIVEIDEKGRVASTSIFPSSGSSALDVATQRMVASCRYVVDRVDGQPVASTKTEFVAFQLGGVETYEGNGSRSRYDRATCSHLTRSVGL